MSAIMSRLNGYITQVRRTTVKDFFQIFKISKKWKNIFYLNFYILFTLVFCPYLDNKFNDNLDNNPFFFFYVALAAFCFNLWNSKKTNDYKFLNISSFSISSPIKIFFVKGFNSVSFLTLNWFYLNFIKFFFFLRGVIFFKNSNIFKQFYTLCTSTIYWSPLFKKNSYHFFSLNNSARFIK